MDLNAVLARMHCAASGTEQTQIRYQLSSRCDGFKICSARRHTPNSRVVTNRLGVCVNPSLPAKNLPRGGQHCRIEFPELGLRFTGLDFAF